MPDKPYYEDFNKDLLPPEKSSSGSPWGHQPPSMNKEAEHRKMYDAYGSGNVPGKEEHEKFASTMEAHGDTAAAKFHRIIGDLSALGQRQHYVKTKAHSHATARFIPNHGGYNNDPYFSIQVRDGNNGGWGGGYHYSPSAGWHYHGNNDVPRKIHALPSDIQAMAHEHLDDLARPMNVHISRD